MFPASKCNALRPNLRPASHTTECTLCKSNKGVILPSRIALAVSVGILAGIAGLLYGYSVLPLTIIWASFIAWASFFAAGGGSKGFGHSVLANLAGVVIATLTLLAWIGTGATPIALGLLLVVGAGALVLISYVAVFSATPAAVLGFATTVGVVFATKTSVTDQLSFTHPTVATAIAVIVGAIFGFASEKFAGAMTRTSVPTPTAEQPAPARIQ